MLYIIFVYVAAILEICKLILPHGRSSLVPPHFAFPMSYGSYMPNFTILIRSADFATFLALNKPTKRQVIYTLSRKHLVPLPILLFRSVHYS